MEGNAITQTKIALPLSTSSMDGINLDEDFMEKVVTNSSYWNHLQSNIRFDTIDIQDSKSNSRKKPKADIRT